MKKKRCFIYLVYSLMIIVCSSFGCAQWKGEPKPYFELSSKFERQFVLDKWVDEHQGQKGFWAGAAMRDVTPQKQVYIAGFGVNRKSEGILDPVYCHAVFMSDGETPIVLVSFDFVGLMGTETWRIRRLVTKKHFYSILIGSAHNHEGPDTIGYWGPGLFYAIDNGVDQKWMDWVRVEAAKTIEEAVESARPAKLKFGSITVPEGISENLWFPHEWDKKDNELTTIQAIELETNRPIFTLVNYALHVEALLEHNKKISSDWAGRMYKYLIEAGQGVPIFFAGAIGGIIVPYPNIFEERPNYREIDKRVEWIEWAGKRLAELTIEALENGDEVESPKISHVYRVLNVPMKNPIYKFAFKNKIVLADPEFIKEDKNGAEVITEMHALNIGPSQILTVFGEPFWTLGFDIKNVMKSKYRFILCLVIDEYGYIMKESDWDDKKHYGYERTVSLGRTTGKIVYNTAIELINELQNAGVGE